MGMIALRINKHFPDKVILVILSMRIKGWLTIYLKGRMSIPYLLGLGVVRNIMVGVCSVAMVAICVVRLAT